MYRFMSWLFITILIINYISMGQTMYKPTWESLDSRPTPAWFEDAKFGIFIHWGLYSVPSWGPTKGVGIYEKYAEWYWQSLINTNRESHPLFKAFHAQTYGEHFKYQDFVRYFTCDMFEPEEWARIFVGSGAKYIVLTSKHHEGFALWPSTYAWNWNAVDAGPHRDLAGDLIKAVRAAGLRMGFYYSLYEWYNPLYHKDVDTYVDTHMLPQMKELVLRYKPDVFWPDGEWDYPSETWRSQEFLSWLYNESPIKAYVAVNDRWGKETRSKHGGYYTTEYDLIHQADANAVQMDHPWEECRGIGTSFGFNRNEYLENYSTSEALIHILINKVARGGNLLLNIGPTADGRIPVIMQQRLKDMGDWLRVNGEGIYGTRKWKKAPIVTPETKHFFTTKGSNLYCICTKYPSEPLVVKELNRLTSITMLGYNGNIDYSFENGTLHINPPVITPANIPCDYAWTFKLSGAVGSF
jgi:alpha-L-fucosidase